MFVWPSLSRKGTWNFLSDRLLRILPFLLVVLLLMPGALPDLSAKRDRAGIAAYWRHWLARRVAVRTDVVLVAAAVVGHCRSRVVPLLAQHRDRAPRVRSHASGTSPTFSPGSCSPVLAYVPLALVSDLGMVSPRPVRVPAEPAVALPAFFAGAASGACGIERGLLGADGPLARHWARWLAAAIGSFVLWIAVMSQIVADPTGAPLLWQIAAALSLLLACFASCFFSLGTAVRFAQFRTRLFDSLGTMPTACT